MMNSPWAMLITFICPNVNVRPRAIISSTAPTLIPVNNCDQKIVTTDASTARSDSLTRLARADQPVGLPSWPGNPTGSVTVATARSRQALGPVVALQVGIGLDRCTGVPDLLDLTIRLDDS